MAEVSKSDKKKKHWIYKLRNKYRLVFMNEETFEEKLSFRLSRLNVFITIGATVIILIIATTFLIAFTPLREYIPGYTDVTLYEKVNRLQNLTDSIEDKYRQQSLYIQNIKNIVEGKEIIEDTSTSSNLSTAAENIRYEKSMEDSILRQAYENETSFNLYYQESDESADYSSSQSNYHFINPLKGIITTEFNLAIKHYGIDIVAKKNEAVKATMDGTVIFSDWTVATGYVIGIQHIGNYISIYKHNSVLLKEIGNFVKSGEPIAIVGESGELSTGPHLHFELWSNGTPVNPKEYIAF